MRFLLCVSILGILFPIIVLGIVRRSADSLKVDYAKHNVGAIQKRVYIDMIGSAP